jgi:serine/threonine protein kinase
MALSSGTRFGSYEVAGQIDAGGMGEVYRAIDTKLGREVAIKTLPKALAQDRERLARFEREAKLLAAINHAHIAAIYGLDEQEGTLFIAMELVEGETLEEKLKAGSLTVENALRLGLQIAEALEAAHEKGIVHRDLKPANVIVTADGVVKVLDFGLAKVFTGERGAFPGSEPCYDAAGTGARHRWLHEPGAGERSGDGPARRCLGLRRGALRDVNRYSAIQRRVGAAQFGGRPPCGP